MVKAPLRTIYRTSSPPPIEAKPFDIKACLLACGVFLLFSALLGLFYEASVFTEAQEISAEKARIRWKTAPCEDFRYDSLDRIPGRCLGYTVITETTDSGVKHTFSHCRLTP